VLRVAVGKVLPVAGLNYVSQLAGEVDALRRRLDALDVALAELVDTQGADVDAPVVGEVAHRVDHRAGLDQRAGSPVHQVLRACRIDVDHGSVIGAHQCILWGFRLLTLPPYGPEVLESAGCDYSGKWRWLYVV
jgi:hypothetical protein